MKKILCTTLLCAGLLGVAGMASAAAIKDFDGDLRDDILWWNISTGEVLLWLSDDGYRRLGTVHPISGWVPVSAMDFNGDYTYYDNYISDIVWWNRYSGQLLLWPHGQSSASISLAIVPPSSGWIPVTVADFDGDYRGDILWWNTYTGNLLYWFSSAKYASFNAGNVPGSSNWLVVGAADFDKDHKDDILWWHSITGEVLAWTSDGTRSLGKVSPDTGWAVWGTADFDKDWLGDILWWNHDSGELHVWPYSGQRYLRGTVSFYSGWMPIFGSVTPSIMLNSINSRALSFDSSKGQQLFGSKLEDIGLSEDKVK